MVDSFCPDGTGQKTFLLFRWDGKEDLYSLGGMGRYVFIYTAELDVDFSFCLRGGTVNICFLAERDGTYFPYFPLQGRFRCTCRLFPALLVA